MLKKGWGYLKKGGKFLMGLSFDLGKMTLEQMTPQYVEEVRKRVPLVRDLYDVLDSRDRTIEELEGEVRYWKRQYLDVKHGQRDEEGEDG